MSRTIGLATLFLVVCAFDRGAGGEKDKGKKFEIPKTAIAGTVKSVDLKKPSFTVTVEGGKERTLLVDKTTEFFGPKGGDRGTGEAGLKDDCMAPGYEIKFIAAKGGKTAKEVYLPERKK